MKEPLGSSTADEFILSRSNAKLFIKMLKRMGLSGQPCLTIHTDVVGQYKKNVCQMFADSIS